MTTTAIGIDRSLADVLPHATDDCPIDGDPVDRATASSSSRPEPEPLHTDDGREVAANAVVLAGMAVTYDDRPQRTVLRRYRRRPTRRRKPRRAVRRRLRRPVRPRLHRRRWTAATCPTRPPSTRSSDSPRAPLATPSWPRGLVSGYIRAFALPCIDWPAQAPEALQPVTAARRAPRSSSSATPATTPPPTTRPNESPARSRHGRLLTYHGTGHTTYGKNVCADTYIDAYLLDLSLPPDGAECR